MLTLRVYHEVVMTSQTDTDREDAFLASLDPEMRNEVARDVIHGCRRAMVKRIAEASRQGNTKLVDALKLEQTKYDNELRLVTSNDGAAIDRALTQHSKFLRQFNQASRDGQRPPNLSDGPR